VSQICPEIGLESAHEGDRRAAISGQVFRVEGKRRPVWRAKYRLPDGRQVQHTIGPAWTARGRPAAGYFTKRSAEAWLSSVLSTARAGALPGMVRTGVTFAEACEEYLRWLEQDRDRKPSTGRDYGSVIRAHLLPAFGSRPIEDIADDDIERWKVGLGVESGMSNATKLKILLMRAAADEQDADLHDGRAERPAPRRARHAALARHRLAGQSIRVRASYTEGGLTTPKSGKVRAVPMAPQVSSALARLAARDAYTGNDDLVFTGTGGGYLNASALYRRYKRALELAGLRPLRFHDLRHAFGTRTIATAPILQVKAWMGHADTSQRR
jgi:integrase